MSEIDDRLAGIKERIICDDPDFDSDDSDFDVDDDMLWLCDQAIELRRQLVEHAAEAGAACQEWDVKCQELETAAAEWRADVVRLTQERARLRGRLATVAALVPSAELMERAAKYADIAQAHYLQGATSAATHHSHFQEKVADEETLDALATAIRAWRGDGDEEEGG